LNDTFKRPLGRDHLDGGGLLRGVRHHGNGALAERGLELFLHFRKALLLQVGQFDHPAEFLKMNGALGGGEFLFQRTVNVLREPGVRHRLGQHGFQEVQQLGFVFCFGHKMGRNLSVNPLVDAILYGRSSKR
jgi:hypothetical protein